jgi:hypothetical protein
MISILDAAASKRIIVALDLSLAFDRASTTTLFRLMEHLGAGRKHLRLLGLMWKTQSRLFAMRGVCLPHTVPSAGPLAQGDAWSPIGMSVLMLTIYLRVGFACSLSNVIYVDDRTAVTGSAEQTEELIRMWTTTSAEAGFTENLAKIQVWTKTKEGREALRRHESLAHIVVEEAVVLGQILCDPDYTSKKEAEVYEEVLHRLSRIACLPVSRKVKRLCIAARCTAKAAVGRHWLSIRQHLYVGYTSLGVLESWCSI